VRDPHPCWLPPILLHRGPSLARGPLSTSDGHREPVAGSLMYAKHSSPVLCSSSNAMGLALLPDWKPPASIEVAVTTAVPFNWGGIFHFLIGIFCYMGREWENSPTASHAPWICVALQRPCSGCLGLSS